MNIIQVLSFFTLLVLRCAVAGGGEHSSHSFSTGEQALFGRSSSDDCLFGASSTVFPKPDTFDEVLEVKNVEKQNLVFEQQHQASGVFGPRLSFAGARRR